MGYSHARLDQSPLQLNDPVWCGLMDSTVSALPAATRPLADIRDTSPISTKVHLRP